MTSNVACAARSRSGRDATTPNGDDEVAVDPRRRDGDRLERALPADAAGRRGVEGALDEAQVRVGRVDLDDVRGEVFGRPGRDGLETLRQAEPERELLVVARRPHRDGDRLPVDADLERLLDGEPVLLDFAAGEPPHRGLPRRVRPRRAHAVSLRTRRGYGPVDVREESARRAHERAGRRSGRRRRRGRSSRARHRTRARRTRTRTAAPAAHRPGAPRAAGRRRRTGRRRARRPLTRPSRSSRDSSAGRR